jgi:arylsulfatase A-like enzyme
MRILYIDIDSQRPDHFGCYGYHRNTSPTIDAIAREGVRCDNVYTSDAPCLPSRTGFYAGRFGIQTGVVGHGGTAAEPKREGKYRSFRDRFYETSLPHQLTNAGFHTAMISPFGERHAAWWFYAAFREIHNTGKRGMESAEDVMPVVNDWLERRGEDDNWYLHINFWDPHTPYRVPESYGNPFEDEPLPAWLTEERLAEHRSMAGPHSALDPGMFGDEKADRYPRAPRRVDSMENLKKWIDGYDTAVRYVDDQIASIVATLKRLGVYEDTAVIISGDHGENLGELGIYGEHGTADHITCRVPMIVKWPGGPAGADDQGLHYHLDWAPTLIQLLELGEPPAIWDGRSYAEVFRRSQQGRSSDGGGTDPESGRDQLVVSQGAHVAQRSVRFGPYLYIRSYHDGFHLFPKEMLFNVEEDPHETENLASAHPELCKEGAWRLANWHDDQMWKMSEYASDMVDPLWQVIAEGGPFHATHRPEDSPLPRYLKRLEETDRAGHAAELRKRYGRFLSE